LKAANITVDHTCWPGMIHGFATFAGVVDAGKVLIDRTSAALRKEFRIDCERDLPLQSQCASPMRKVCGRLAFIKPPKKRTIC
jgi:hypothetical protein